MPDASNPIWKKILWSTLTEINRLKHAFWSAYWTTIFPGNVKKLKVLGRIWVVRPNNIHLGDNVTLNHGCYINARGPINIGDHTHLSPFVMINAGSLVIEVTGRPHEIKEVNIGKNVWLATNVIVNPGVTISDGVVVGSGAVVSRDLPAYTLCVGVPAKPIKQLQRPRAL